jgi:hypothetical protein
LEAIEPERVVAPLSDRGACRADTVLGRRDHRNHEHRDDRDRTDPHQPPRPVLEREQATDRGGRQHHRHRGGFGHVAVLGRPLVEYEAELDHRP